MKAFILILILFIGSWLQAETALPVSGAKSGREISGIVRIIRANPQTEVFFKDLKDSVIIPQGKKHNQIYEACEVSWKKATPVKLIIDPVSRQVISLPEPASDPAVQSLEKNPEADMPSTK